MGPATRLTSHIFAASCVLTSMLAWGQFETRASFPVLYYPTSIAVGDFNHDGNLDLAVAAPSDGNLAVLLGNGDGTFRPAIYYRAGTNPSSINAADLNHDGNLDLAVVSDSDSYVSILLGNGDGTFQPATQTPATPNRPTYVAIADFNGDGKPDLAVVAFPYISVLLGNGDGSFQPAINTLPPDESGPIGIGDFNRDGKPDVAVAPSLGGSGGITILLGNGDGTFTTGQTYTVGSGPTALAVADFNHDKNPDLAVSNLSDGADVLLGNGDGTFQAAMVYVKGSAWIAVGDFNNDGNLDLASAQSSFPSGVFVRPGNGKGQFGPYTYYPDGKDTVFVAVGDFNNDHKPDLVVADNLASSVIVMLNTGVVTFSPTSPVNFAAQLVNTVSAPQSVSLTNTGKTALSITSMRVTGDFQMSSTCGHGVAPGANCSVTAKFEPQTKGPLSGAVSISDSASTQAQVIELTGVGTVVTISPGSLNFGSQKVGTTSAPQPVTITNMGSAPLNFTSIKILGVDPQDFLQTNTCGSQIGAGASCTVNVTFSPTKTGSRQGKVSITDDGGASPQSVALTGTGN